MGNSLVILPLLVISLLLVVSNSLLGITEEDLGKSGFYSLACVFMFLIGLSRMENSLVMLLLRLVVVMNRVLLLCLVS